MCDEKRTPKQSLEMWLSFARKRSLKQQVSHEVRQVYLLMDQVPVSLQFRKKLEIELPQLLLKGYEAEAKKWLQLVRSRSKEESIEGLIPYIYEYLDKAKINAGPWLEKNGLSADNIENIKVKGYESEAKKMLQKALYRVCEGNVLFEINRVWQFLDKAGLTPEDIGTSKCELDQLLMDGEVSEFRKNKNPSEIVIMLCEMESILKN